MVSLMALDGNMQFIIKRARLRSSSPFYYLGFISVVLNALNKKVAAAGFEPVIKGGNAVLIQYNN